MIAVCYDHLSVASQKEYVKRFPNAQNKILEVDGVLPASPAADKLSPGDLIWAVDGQPVGTSLVDFDMAMNKSAKDHVLLTIFRNGCYQDITLPLYNLEDHRITKMVQFGGTTFFETDDLASHLGGVAAKTLACCVAQPNTIFKGVNYIPRGSLRTWAMELLAINGQPIQTLDALISAIPKLVQQKYFTIEYVDCLPRDHGIWTSFAHTRCKNNVEYDASLAPPKVWRWDPIQLEWKGEEIVL